MTERRDETRIILFLTALVITLFLALPRLAIILFIRTRPLMSVENISWWDFSLKCLFGFLVAWIFLWVNTSKRKIITRWGNVNLSKLPHRIIVNLILYWLVRYIGLWLEVHTLPAVVIVEKLHKFIFNLSLILEICICILAAEIYKLLVKNQQVRLRNELLKKLNAEANFEVLKNQVNPHFFFNSLNTINAMISSSNETAKKFVENMSQVYRYVLNSSQQQVVSLSEELEFTMAYMNMLKERYAGKIMITITIDEQRLTELLPPMSLQILIENALKHNIVSVKTPLHISIIMYEDSLMVKNSLQEKKSKPASMGTGLYNLHQRYLYLCGREVEISRTENDFIVRLPLLKNLSGVNLTANSYHSS